MGHGMTWFSLFPGFEQIAHYLEHTKGIMGTTPVPTHMYAATLVSIIIVLLSLRARKQLNGSTEAVVTTITGGSPSVENVVDQHKADLVAETTKTMFTRVTWTKGGTTQVIGTAKEPGRPFVISTSKVSTAGAVSMASTTANSGPHDWGTSGNWSNGIPVDDDDVKVLEYADRLKIFQRHNCLAEYPLPPDGVRLQRFSPPGQPKPRFQPKHRRRDAKQEEQRLRALGDEVANYLDYALKAPGVQRHRFTRELFALSRKVTPSVLLKTAQRALHYRIVDLATVRRIAWLCISQAEDVLPEADVDEDLQQRPAYQEGCLTDQPDLSVYDQLFEEQENEEKENEEKDSEEKENEDDDHKQEECRDDDHKQEECEDDDQPW